MPSAAVLSYRLGGTDGVSIESEKWRRALEHLGFSVRTVAGGGSVDHLVRGLAMTAEEPVDGGALERALDGTDLVVIENLCSLPLNPVAAETVAGLCAGRSAILHHHDLSWQRPHLGSDPPPDDPAWRHVTINELSRRELSTRGITATTIYNRFDTTVPAGARGPTRATLGIADDERLVLQPTRALPRKNVAAGIALAERLDATFWLTGRAEDGYGPELDRLLGAARCPVHHRFAPGGDARDAYAACDVVVLPSSWEGFGNPAIESAVHRRPLCIGDYPVAAELAAFGFIWFALGEPDRLQRWLREPDPSVLEHNWAVADANFSLRDLPGRLADVLRTLPVSY